MDGEERSFSSPQEEIRYWKKLAKENAHFKQSFEETKEELEEYQISSRELEAELEAILEQQENKNKELVAANERLQNEVQSLREKLEETSGMSHKQISSLESEKAQVSAIKEELTKYIRELEQANDDLERAKRATVVSLEDFEHRLNQAIERNAFLESELEERETLSVTVQRLKDESRDLKEELAVRTTKKVLELEPEKKDVDGTPIKTEQTETESTHIDSNKLIEETFSTPNNKISYNHSNAIGTPITPSARISALNIVGDLLRKVGALESKLASCRNFVNNQPKNGKPGATSPLSSPSSWGDLLKLPAFLQQQKHGASSSREETSAGEPPS